MITAGSELPVQPSVVPALCEFRMWSLFRLRVGRCRYALAQTRRLTFRFFFAYYAIEG